MATVSGNCAPCCKPTVGGLLPKPSPIIDKVEVVKLLDNVMTPVEITCTELQGAYILVVESVLVDGAKATFMASSGHDAQAGHFSRLTSAPALTDETIHIFWNPNEKIKLYHDTVKTGGVGALLEYNVSIRSI